MNIGWNFPGNNNGQINGISEAGIETFKGALIASLTREICQNSLDAVLKESNKPVRIEFDLASILSEEVPGYSDLQDAIQGCYDFWKAANNEKAVKFFHKAVELINQEEIKILRISDYNTEGLTGSDKEYSSPWQNLVKSNGVSDKGASAGGSFGIGKAAPFACSGIRTVFYRTLDKDGIRAAQGIARLVSYRRAVSDTETELTTGIGYYGNMDRNTCLSVIEALDRLHIRDRSGTDLFILGFEDQDNWQEAMITELLEGFMLAFYRGKLEVKVGEIEITKNTLPKMMEYYKENAKTAYDYYRVMVAENAQIFGMSFENMGIVNLRVLVEEGLNRKVLISRESGMKLFDKNRISSSIQFSGVLDMEGEALNGFFRKMESPQHNAWEDDRYEEDPAKAKKLRLALYKWIKDTIIEIGQCVGGDEMDAEGVGDLLPDYFEYQNQNGEDTEETISDTTKEWKVKIASKPTSIKEQDIEGDSIEGEEVDYGDIQDGGETSQDTPHGEPNDTTGGRGDHVDVGPGEGDRPFMVSKQVKTHKMRLFMSNRSQKEYTLTFTPGAPIKQGYLEIYIAGEQGNMEVNIQSAWQVSGNKQTLSCNKHQIELKNLEKGVAEKITFKLQEDEIYSLEVKLYAREI